ncbi:MAG: acyl-CoA dehydrogenase C-terminal domain-containing protein, partial [Burkholderiales bacterium]
LDAVTVQLATLLATEPDRALANASVYLDAFGRIVAAWIWLKQALAAERGVANSPADADFYRGKLQAARFFFRWELPRIEPVLAALERLDQTTSQMQEAWF